MFDCCYVLYSQVTPIASTVCVKFDATSFPAEGDFGKQQAMDCLLCCTVPMPDSCSAASAYFFVERFPEITSLASHRQGQNQEHLGSFVPIWGLAKNAFDAGACCAGSPGLGSHV